ncbi:MAG: glucose-1-phosphate adenylyltransferase [Chloroflexota bacterium]|nr:glucose-1-phosphate adenylyltransferase [Chloroflexota bacterium]
MPSTNDILGVIMGGGQGSRLYPLTKVRAKPAVPIGGKYRLIDIPLSNCINSDINRIAVLTQFNSVSLHRHITQTYNFDPFHRGWVQIWAAEQTFGDQTWYQGTADAVRKQLLEIRSTGAKYVLVLAGDHLYRMNYAAMAEYHWEKDADICIAVQPVSTDQASRFGILKRNPNGFLTDFTEKPKDPELLKKFISRDDDKRPYLGSMGIYFFKTEILIELLETSSADDFGGEVLPNAIHTKKVVGFDFDGYWEDIGTMRTFYEANLKLTQPNPPFNFYDPHSPIYTHPRFLPGTVLEGAKLEKVYLSDGGYIGQAEIYHSVIGLRSYIQDNVFLKDTILMGADYYEASTHSPYKIPLGVGKNSHIEGALIDKNVRIGNNVVIRPFPHGTEEQFKNWAIRDGIVVIPKSTIIQDNTIIAPD